jgi:hypothetical protein
VLKGTDFCRETDDLTGKATVDPIVLHKLCCEASCGPARLRGINAEEAYMRILITGAAGNMGIKASQAPARKLASLTGSRGYTVWPGIDLAHTNDKRRYRKAPPEGHAAARVV